ncbi:hypothetical protein BKA67DRAFT_584735 [Truncatella angustata]|uniref:Uncharacterized protein n=1 Tax=Truncatella angustata TaxID=152316 RepID=A0A9P8UC36_9PEZI|nr:uncharacterized protein BKA67DRAFT_584735 [Truncatella angustata]KAH6645292.1 hypothetical protein BKA67DRAFT_584735 [Truncatella angustata]
MLLIFLGLIFWDIGRKCHTGEFHESMRDLGNNLWAMIRALTCHLITTPLAIIRIPKSTYH